MAKTKKLVTKKIKGHRDSEKFFELDKQCKDLAMEVQDLTLKLLRANMAIGMYRQEVTPQKDAEIKAILKAGFMACSIDDL